MMNPCRHCRYIEGDKTGPRCQRCEKRIAYLAEIDGVAIPMHLTHLGRMTKTKQKRFRGRPRKKPEDRRPKIAFRTSPEIMEWLRCQPDGITATTEKALRMLMENDNHETERQYGAGD